MFMKVLCVLMRYEIVNLMRERRRTGKLDEEKVEKLRENKDQTNKQNQLFLHENSKKTLNERKVLAEISISVLWPN